MVAAEVDRRLASGDLRVPDDAPYDDPLGLLDRANTIARVKRRLAVLGVAAVVAGLIGLFLRWGGENGWGLAGVVLAFGLAVLLYIVRSRNHFAPHPSGAATRRVLTQRVRLTEAARRNGVSAHLIKRPGTSVFPKHNPVRRESVLSPLQWPPPGVVFHASDPGWRPAEWGTCTYLARPGGAITFVVVDVSPVSLPHFLLQATTDLAVPLRLDPAQIQPIDSDFDRHFTVYAPDEPSGQAARDLLTLGVRQRLVADAGQWSIEVVGRAIICFRAGETKWDEWGDWETVTRLRTLVDDCLLPGLIETTADFGGPGLKPGAYQVAHTVGSTPPGRSPVPLRHAVKSSPDWGRYLNVAVAIIVPVLVVLLVVNTVLQWEVIWLAASAFGALRAGFLRAVGLVQAVAA